MSNFTFLQTEWPSLYETAVQMEAYVRSDPRSACFYARRAVELAVRWLYLHDRAFQPPYDERLESLLNEPSFRAHVPTAVYEKAHYLRRIGNEAVHSRRATPASDGLNAAIELHHLLYWLARTYTQGDPTAIPGTFDETRLPPPAEAVIQQTAVQLQSIEAQLRLKDDALREQQQENARLLAEIAQLKAQKAINTAVPDTHNYSEAETRRRIIDVMLREAGWDPTAPNVAEFPVTGMPSNSGDGKVDYVLWGDNGLPLAVVEAKRTTVEAQAGQQQAKLYADCLEKMYGQRPIIFYSNGYQTYLWDDTRYPARQVQGYYTQDELAWLIQQRTAAKPLATMTIDTNIIDGRPYQEEAIRRLTERFSQHQRKGLWVMATGTGKTRVAIALVDLLMRAGWVRRVLFLADRSALVRQAVRAFKSHLPTSNPVNLTEASGKAQAPAARVVVSTYHTMMNLIDESQEDGQKLFSVGHFDLVFIDEAHRSVYQKFGAIFTYFDSLLVGLTATPKDDIDRNTYDLFNLETGVPTFAYDLEQAVKEKHLVPYRIIPMTTSFLREGIHYNNLTPEEQAEWDLLDWGDGDEIPNKVEAAALNNWLFNQDTVDRILKGLMEHGLKVAGGDRLGKTILFAKNHKHAAFIEERFNVHYPEHAGHFAQVIDNTVNFVQNRIDDFSQPDKMPHIAISVDMLDTGIDVPEVVNLVFFKIVHSKTKFFQMIGRGTRLRPHLFGPGQDKSHFLIFDACQNFEFFGQHPEGVKDSVPESLSSSLFRQRLALLGETAVAAHPELLAGLKDILHAQVAAMNLNNFVVRPFREYVEPFQNRQRWESLSHTDRAQLARHVAGLPTTLAEGEESAKRFDSLILQLQLAHLQDEPTFALLKNRLLRLVANLHSKTTIPKVQAQLPLLSALQTESYWQAMTLPQLEEVRQALRELVLFADKAERTVLYTRFADRLDMTKEETDPYLVSPGVDVAQYQKMVNQFIQEHERDEAMQKIHAGIPLSPHDLQALEKIFYAQTEDETQAKFVQVYGRETNLATLMRSLVGLDEAQARVRFAQFLDGRTYNANQIRFVDYIIEHLAKNGTISLDLLYEQPFTHLHPHGISGLFADAERESLLMVLKSVNVVVAA